MMGRNWEQLFGPLSSLFNLSEQIDVGLRKLSRHVEEIEDAIAVRSAGRVFPESPNGFFPEREREWW